MSNNIDDRLKEHNNGKASKYTRVRLPVQVIYTEEFENRSQASKREYAVKRLNRIQKEQLVEKRQ
ncbi:MAG: GIY-YIG nuclease family protein [Candidatus Omnitrophica bacterium]|nr:GIY-YIG nuclease family protein [Candidatus Omnitrophota bacterium]